jgi:hypothetical protein
MRERGWSSIDAGTRRALRAPGGVSMDTLQGPALAEALARLAPGLRDVKPATVGGDRRALGTIGHYDGNVCLDLRPDEPKRKRYALLVSAGDVRLTGYGPTPEAARDDALSRLRAGYDAVRDVLDPWREGPPDTDGWYEVECEYRVDEAPTEPGVWTDGMWLLPGDASGWPTVSGRPARYRALHLSAPPERGTDA